MKLVLFGIFIPVRPSPYWLATGSSIDVFVIGSVLARNGTEMYRVHAATGGKNEENDSTKGMSIAHRVNAMTINHHVTHLSPVAIATDLGISFMKPTRAQSWFEDLCMIPAVRELIPSHSCSFAVHYRICLMMCTDIIGV
jgi:hypothetical protein